MPPPIDWRSPHAYAHLSELDEAGIAWAFLRRNPAFSRDCHPVPPGTLPPPALPPPCRLRSPSRPP